MSQYLFHFAGKIKTQNENLSFLLEESKEPHYDLSSIFYLFELGERKMGLVF